MSTKAELWARVRKGGGLVSAASTASRRLPVLAPCIHGGTDADILERCPTCNGGARHVRECAVHERCTREPVNPVVMDCARCRREGLGYEADTDGPELPAFTEVTTRHLLYHVYPRSGSRWRARLARLREHLGLFNGKKFVAVAFDTTTDSPDAVRAALAGTDCEVFGVPNNPALREVQTFIPLFGAIADLREPGHATLYAHAKGVTRPEGATCHRWAEVLEEIMLGDWPAVEKQLARHPVAGCFKKMGRGWPRHESHSEWHYSGSWFWFRNAELFARDWQKIDQFWSGIEPYPSLHFTAEEAGCIFHTAPVPAMNLYNPAYWRRAVESTLAKRPRPTPTPAAPAPILEGLRIEIGGGATPRGVGWINADRCPGADVVLDLERDPLPWPDESVAGVYSSHCFEHILNLKHLLSEVVRVCKVGASVEIRVPHPFHEMALCHDHKQTIGDEQVRHWCESAVPYWFGDSPRRLVLTHTERIPSAHFAEAKLAFPNLSDDQVMRFISNTCHETRYRFEVIANDLRQ